MDQPRAYQRASAGSATAPVATSRRADRPERPVVRATKPKPAPVVRAPAPVRAEARPVLVATAKPVAPPRTDPAPAPPAPRSFYSFTDDEIRALRKRSPAFKRLLTKHRRCTKRTEKVIAKRQRIREKIIHLQNLDAPSRAQLKQLTNLRKQEHRMKRDTDTLAACQTLEEQLTGMLRETYEATASIDY